MLSEPESRYKQTLHIALKDSDLTPCASRQVEGRSSVIETFKQLLAEEGAWGLTKGLSARIISSTPTSVMIVIGYETLKRLSLRPELVDSRHW